MTREDAYNFKVKVGDQRIPVVTKVPIKMLVDEIYNNFKSRTCKNCKYYNEKDNICNRKEITMLLPKNFSCNKFKVKEIK